jgi:hypothetical protein
MTHPEVGGRSGRGVLEFPGGAEGGLDPVGGDVAALVGVGPGGEELDADFANSDINQAGKADGAEDEVGDLLAYKVRDDNMLSRFEGVAGEKGHAAGGEISGMDVGPGLARAAGDAEPHGVDIVNAGADATFGGGGRRGGVKTVDDGTDPLGFFARKSDMLHDLYLPLAGDVIDLGQVKRSI